MSKVKKHPGIFVACLRLSGHPWGTLYQAILSAIIPCVLPARDLGTMLCCPSLRWHCPAVILAVQMPVFGDGEKLSISGEIC